MVLHREAGWGHLKRIGLMEGYMQPDSVWQIDMSQFDGLNSACGAAF
jgi:hypothetical protein